MREVEISAAIKGGHLIPLDSSQNLKCQCCEKIVGLFHLINGQNNCEGCGFPFVNKMAAYYKFERALNKLKNNVSKNNELR